MDLFKERKLYKYLNIPIAYAYMHELVHTHLCVYIHAHAQTHEHMHTYRGVAMTHTAGTVFKEEKELL